MCFDLPQFVELPVCSIDIIRQGMRGGKDQHCVRVAGIKRMRTLSIDDCRTIISEFELSLAGEEEPVWQRRVARTEPHGVENVLEPLVGAPQQYEGAAELRIGWRMARIKLD